MKSLLTLTSLALAILILISCKGNRILRIEIYCRGARDIMTNVGPHLDMVESVVSTRTDQVIKPEFLWYETSSDDTVQKIAGLFLKSQHNSESSGSLRSDAHFLVLLYHANQTTDTLSYQNFQTFIFNEEKTFRYRLNVMDSLRKIIGAKEIDCGSEKGAVIVR